jgi:hypothetical protein
MMTADHIATLCGGEDYSPTDRRYARVAVQAFKEFVAPILAAKDAKIAELDKQLLASAKTTLLDVLERLGDHAHVMNPETETWSVDEVWTRILKHVDDLVEHRTGGLRERVATLEKQLATGANDIELPTNQECINAYEYHFKLSSASGMNRSGGPSFFDLQRAGMGGVLGLVREKLGPAMAVKKLQLIEAQQRVVELEREQRECLSLITESRLVMPGRTLAEAVKDLIELHGYAAKKIAELTACVDVNGKTPGQVSVEARRSATLKRRAPFYVHDVYDGEKVDNAAIEEEAALAVLRAFGQPSQTTQNAVEVLNKLASYWEKGAAYEGMPEQYRRGLKDCAKELREELAKLSAEPPSDATTPKVFVNENGLRGSYFCTQFPFRPFLHIGHDIEFDDIPRILKLGRNDVIEVRVVERAKS